MRGRVVDGLLGRLLALSPDEATFRRRGFAGGTAAARERLEGIGRTFITGYNEALAAPSLAALSWARKRCPRAPGLWACWSMGCLPTEKHQYWQDTQQSSSLPRSAQWRWVLHNL